MKKSFLFTLILVVVSATAFAQDKRVREISKLYSVAMEQIARMKEEPNCEESMTVKKHYIVPAIGPVEETIEFFADDVADQEKNAGSYELVPFFIRVKTDAGPTVMSGYEEFLFHPNHSLAFCFKKSRSVWAETDVDIETRAYFDTKGKYITGNVKLKDAVTGEDVPVLEDIQIVHEDLKKAAEKYLKNFKGVF